MLGWTNRRMRDDGGEKKKSGGIWETSPWVGKHLILVKAVVGGVKSIFVVVDLEEQKIVMESKVPVFSDNRFESTAVLHEGTLYVLNMCLEEYTDSDFSLEIPLDSDECNSSTLDLTKNPPEWSGGWTSLPKMNIKRLLPPVVVLYNKIYVFDFDSKDHPAEVYQIGGDKWEKITIPSGNLLDKPIPDPKGNRLIAFFDDSLYAYHPNIEKWNLVHQHLSRDNPLDASDVIVWGEDDSLVSCPVIADPLDACDVTADQVVGDGLILYFNITYQIFLAYSIVTNMWLNVRVRSPFDCKINFGATSQLVHLGNDILCLAESHQGFPEFKTDLEFLRFSVELVNDDQVLLKYLSFHTIVLDKIRCFADNFIPF